MVTPSVDVTTESSLDFNTTTWFSEMYDVYANISKNETDNTTTNGTTDAVLTLPHPLWLTIALGTAASIVIIVTILGNILVLLSFFLERSIRQPTNYFIASLAMSDLLIGTFSMPCFTLYLLLGYWPLGEIICDLWLSLDWTVCLASQYTVFFITADRFCSVKIPAKYRNWRTDRKVRVMIALSWIIPSLVFFTSIVGWQYFVGVRTVEKDHCEVQFMSDPLFTFLLTIGYFWTTLIVMIVLYVGIYRVALSLQRRANEKQKKMHNAMEMAKDRSSRKTGGAKQKASKKRVENNNARYLRGPNDTITTSFSKNSDNEGSKPSEEDRSSSPAFASDDDEGSIAERKTESCYVNSAVQTEPTLKGMLGTSFNHMSRLAFSISGTSVSASQSSDKDSIEEHTAPHLENDQDKPLLTEATHKFEPIKESPSQQENSFKDGSNHLDQSSSPPAMEKDILDGLKYIDEDSLKSLTSSENVKLLAEIKDMPVLNRQPNGAESPVWRKRDDDKTLLVPVSNDSGSSEGLANIADPSKVRDSRYGISEDNNESGHNKYKCEETNAHGKSGGLHFPNASNHGSSKKKSKFRKQYGSPLQSLVNSLRPSAKEKKAPKSKSENRARKALRTISIILGAYLLCWTPYHILILIIGICGNYNCINLQFYYFTYWLCYLNSPINPFCYAFANAQFKRTFIRILKLDFHRT